MAQNSIVEAEDTFQLFNHSRSAFNVHQHIMCLGGFFDRIGQQAPAPVFQTMDVALAVFDQGFVAINHRRNLITLVGMDQKNDLIVSHVISFRVPVAVSLPEASRRDSGEAR